MIIRGNKHTAPTDLYRIRESAARRVINFEKELKESINSWISDLDNESYEYVGSRVDGPPPVKRTIPNRINSIISSIESYGEE